MIIEDGTNSVGRHSSMRKINFWPTTPTIIILGQLVIKITDTNSIIISSSAIRLPSFTTEMTPILYNYTAVQITDLEMKLSQTESLHWDPGLIFRAVVC